MQKIAPRFEVERLEGKVTKTVYAYTVTYLKDDETGEFVRDDEGRKIMISKQREEKAVEVDAGWMIYFPRGHSVHITDPNEMRRLGFFSDPELIDLESESEEDRLPQLSTSLKEQHDRRNTSRRRRAATASKNAEVTST